MDFSSLFAYITGHDIKMFFMSCGILLSIFVFGEVLRRLMGYTGNFTRKVVHMGVSLWACWVFYVFEQKYVPVVMSGLFFVANHKYFRSKIFRIADIKNQHHPGMVYYPVAMGLIFWFCWEIPYRFAGIIGLLNLGIGDAVAALVGERWGKKSFVIGHARKTYVGSLCMFLCSLCITGYILLNILPEFGLFDAIAVLSIAVTATLLEAVCGRELDNISIPLGSTLVYSWFYL